MRKVAFAFAATAALVVSAPVGAATIISENFESGLGVFTASGQAGIATGNDYIPCCGTTGSPANMANHFVTFGSGNLPSGLITTPINLLTGESYVLQFDYDTLGAGVDQITALIDGQVFTASVGANNNLDTGWLTFAFGFTASGAPTNLQFFSNGTINADAIVDNVLLTGPAAPVPEPATWAMMLVGFAGIGMAMRRRKATVAALA